MSSILNASASGGLVSTGDTSANLELQSDGTTKFTVSPTGAYGTLRLSTAQTMTAAGLPSSLPSAGLYADFTGIPSWTKRITVVLAGVSTNGSSQILIQLGGSGGVETTGYLGGTTTTSVTTGFLILLNLASRTGTGSTTLVNLNSNLWVASGATWNTVEVSSLAGSKTLSTTLDRLRVTTVNGTDVFDGGTVNILIEG